MNKTWFVTRSQFILYLLLSDSLLSFLPFLFPRLVFHTLISHSHIFTPFLASLGFLFLVPPIFLLHGHSKTFFVCLFFFVLAFRFPFTASSFFSSHIQHRVFLHFPSASSQTHSTSPFLSLLSLLSYFTQQSLTTPTGIKAKGNRDHK